MAFCHIFPILARMKKWMITYVILLSFLSISLCGQASPAGQTFVHSSFKTVSKKSISSERQNTDDSRDGYQSLHQHIRFSLSITPSFTIGGTIFPVSSDYVITQSVIAAEVERVLKDHLLHLFPFHYFW
jgi:hypothetical protein